MSTDFKFSFDERALDQVVNSHLDEMSRLYTRDFARLVHQYKGQPVSSIRPQIQAIFRRHGGSITSPELDEYAQLVSDGVAITFGTKQ